MSILLIAKSILVPTVIGLLTGGIGGKLYSIKYPDHAHQIFPAWMIFSVVCGFITLIVAIIGTIFLAVRGTLPEYSNKLGTISAILGIVSVIVIMFVARK